MSVGVGEDIAPEVEGTIVGVGLVPMPCATFVVFLSTITFRESDESLTFPAMSVDLTVML